MKPSARSCSRPSSVILSGPHGGIQTQLIPKSSTRPSSAVLGLVLDDVGQRAGRRGQRHVEGRRCCSSSTCDAVDQAEVDDVDARARGRRRRACASLDVVVARPCEPLGVRSTSGRSLVSVMLVVIVRASARRPRGGRVLPRHPAQQRALDPRRVLRDTGERDAVLQHVLVGLDLCRGPASAPGTSSWIASASSTVLADHAGRSAPRPRPG